MGYAAFVEEIDRIMSSPYPTQLKRLRDLACAECANDDILYWILSKPCQIDSLAKCVLDGLQHWSYVLDIVTRLSYNQTFRDAILRHEPTLLHDIIERAIRARHVDSKYTRAAVAILSHPLPKEVGLPSQAQTLFIQLFDHVAQQPSMSSIKPIYEVLQGTATLFLGVLSSSTLLRFEDVIFTILRNLKGDDHSLSVCCLAIMKILATASQDNTNEFSILSCDTQGLLASTQLTSSSKWKPYAVQQYFTESKAQRTMQLLVLRAMWACTPTTSEDFDAKMEALILANEIIAAVPMSEREVWRKANAQVPRRFETKILSPSLEPALQFQALSFMVRFMEGSIITALVMDSLRQIVINSDSLVKALRVSARTSTEFLAQYGIFDHSTTNALLLNIVDFAVGANPEKLIESSQLLIGLLQHLTDETLCQDSIVDGAMLALDVLSCGRKLHRLSQLIQAPLINVGQSTGHVTCAHALRRARNSLVHELCRVFLRAALASSSKSYSTSPEILALLVDLHASSVQFSSNCNHAQSVKQSVRRALPFVEAESTPDNESVDWRQEIRRELQMRAGSDYDRLLSIFTKTCSDLETRCEEVEGPLRDEQQKCTALQEQYEQAEKARVTLEAESLERKVQIDAIELERDEYMNDLKTMRNENGTLESRIVEMEQQIRDVKARLERQANEGQEALDAAHFKHATALARKEEEVESLQSQVQNAERRLDCKAEELRKAREEFEVVRTSVETNKQELQRLLQSAGDQQKRIEWITEEKNSISESNEQLQASLAQATTELRAEKEAHQASIRRAEGQASRDVATAKSNYEQSLENTAKEHAASIEKFEQSLSDARKQYSDAQEQHASDIQWRDYEIHEKQGKLERLTRECDSMIKKIADADIMHRNVAKMMGLDAQMALPHRPSRPQVVKTQYEGDTQDDLPPPTPFSGDEINAEHTNSRASFTSNVSSSESRSGPTPKRPRSRKSLKAPSPAQPRVRHSLRSQTTRASVDRHRTSTRQALGNVSVNQSPKKIMNAKTPLKKMTNDEDESTLDGSELFVGTNIASLHNIGSGFEE